jgi:hypothetical protein
MFATRYFANSYFAPRYFPKVGVDSVPVVGGPVWVWTNGVSIPPGSSVQGAQGYWMCINGVWVKAHASAAPWPRRCRNNGQH